MGGSPRAMAPDTPPQAPGEPASDLVPEGERQPSLIDEVGALIEDGKTYAEAELAFQKTRLFYVLAHARSIAVLGGLAAVLVVLAVVAAVVGAINGLIPELGPWGAAGVVIAVLLALAAVLGLSARAKLKGLSRAFETTDE